MPSPPGSQWNKASLTSSPWWQTPVTAPSPHSRNTASAVPLSGSRWADLQAAPRAASAAAGTASGVNSIRSCVGNSVKYAEPDPLEKVFLDGGDVSMADTSNSPHSPAVADLPAAQLQVGVAEDSDADSDDPYSFNLAKAYKKKYGQALEDTTVAPAGNAMDVRHLPGQPANLVKLGDDTKQSERADATVLSENEGTATTDNDGDVVMMDLEDPKSLWEVEMAVGVGRNAVKIEFPVKSIGSATRISDPSCVLVVDTSFILSHLQLVNNLVLAHSTWRNVVVLPWATIQELDGLKANSGFNILPSVQSDRGTGMRSSKHAAGGSQRVNVGMLARSAINWAFNKFGELHPGVWGQKKEECVDSSARRGDDSILDCCRFFSDKHDTILLSNDRNLCVQAMVYHLKTVSYVGAPHSAEGILKQILGEPPKLVEAQPPPPIAGLSSKSAKLDLMDQPISPIISPVGGDEMMLDRPEEGLGELSVSEKPEQRIFEATNPSKIEKASGKSETTDRAKDPEASTAPTQPASFQEESYNPWKGYKPKTPALSLMDSDHAPKGGKVQFDYSRDRSQACTIRRRSHAIPIVNPVTPNPISLALPADNQAPQPPRPIHEVKVALSLLLDTIAAELIAFLPGLIHKRLIRHLGSQNDLDYLQVNPFADITHIEHIEQSLHKHHMSTFTELFPRAMDLKFAEGELAKKWNQWQHWANHPASHYAAPSYNELKAWIERWDLIWKKMLITEYETAVNLRTVDRWRTRARGLGLQ